MDNRSIHPYVVERDYHGLSLDTTMRCWVRGREIDNGSLVESMGEEEQVRIGRQRQVPPQLVVPSLSDVESQKRGSGIAVRPPMMMTDGDFVLGVLE